MHFQTICQGLNIISNQEFINGEMAVNVDKYTSYFLSNFRFVGFLPGKPSFGVLEDGRLCVRKTEENSLGDRLKVEYIEEIKKHVLNTYWRLACNWRESSARDLEQKIPDNICKGDFLSKLSKPKCKVVEINFDSFFSAPFLDFHRSILVHIKEISNCKIEVWKHNGCTFLIGKWKHLKQFSDIIRTEMSGRKENVLSLSQIVSRNIFYLGILQNKETSQNISENLLNLVNSEGKFCIEPSGLSHRQT